MYFNNETSLLATFQTEVTSLQQRDFPGVLETNLELFKQSSNQQWMTPKTATNKQKINK